MVEGLQIFLNDRSLTPDSFARTLFNELLKLSPQKHSLIIKFLQPLLSHYSASEVDFNNKVDFYDFDICTAENIELKTLSGFFRV